MTSQAPFLAMIVPALIALAGLAGLVVVAAAALRAWAGWLELQRLALDGRGTAPATGPAARIELADLKERVRKLEAIAAGVEL